MVGPDDVAVQAAARRQVPRRRGAERRRRSSSPSTPPWTPSAKTRQRPTYAAFKEVRGRRSATPCRSSRTSPTPSRSPQLQYLDDRAPRLHQAGRLGRVRAEAGRHGAFKFKEWERDVKVRAGGQRRVLEGEAEGAHGGRSAPIPEDAARIAALQRGEVRRHRRRAPTTGSRSCSEPGSGSASARSEQIYIGLDALRFEPFKKREVRQALNHAVNADALVKNLLLGYAVRLNGPASSRPRRATTTRSRAYAHDPERGQAHAGPGRLSQWLRRGVRGVAEPPGDRQGHGGRRGDRRASSAGSGVRAKLRRRTRRRSSRVLGQEAPDVHVRLEVEPGVRPATCETLLHSKTRGYYYQKPDTDRLIDAYFAEPSTRRSARRSGASCTPTSARTRLGSSCYQQMDLFGVRKNVAGRAPPDYLMRMRREGSREAGSAGACAASSSAAGAGEPGRGRGPRSVVFFVSALSGDPAFSLLAGPDARGRPRAFARGWGFDAPLSCSTGASRSARPSATWAGRSAIGQPALALVLERLPATLLLALAALRRSRSCSACRSACSPRVRRDTRLRRPRVLHPPRAVRAGVLARHHHDPDLRGRAGSPPRGGGSIAHLVLPAHHARHLHRWRGWPAIARSRMLDVLSEDYIRTARAKGLREPG